MLEQRLQLDTPPLIAMGDAPDKPEPRGLIQLSNSLLQDNAGGTVAYLGDTVADVQTVVNARTACPERHWISLAVAPPHLQPGSPERQAYEQQLRDAGADHILPETRSATQWLEQQTSP